MSLGKCTLTTRWGTLSNGAPWTNSLSYAGAHTVANLYGQLNVFKMKYYQYTVGDKM